MAATVIDVGLRAGCSPATVSRVLNGTARVSDVVRENVFKAVEQEGYVPRASTSAKQLGGSRDFARKGGMESIDAVLYLHEPNESISIDRDGFHIGPAGDPDGQWLLTPAARRANSFWHDVVSGVMHELHDWKIKGVVQVNKNLMAPEFLSDVNSGQKRGVLLIGNYSPDLTRFVEACKAPLVLVDMIHESPTDAVIIDNYGGICSAVQHLVSLGHQDIAYFGVSGNLNYHERSISFVTAMYEAGLAVRGEWLSEGAALVESATDRAVELLKKPGRPSAIVCCNDFMALGALRAAERCGIHVPQDLSIVGFDDVDGATFMSPPLTTVRVAKEELGRCAVRQLLLRSALGVRPAEAGSEVRVKTTLIVRQSTGAPHGRQKG